MGTQLASATVVTKLKYIKKVHRAVINRLLSNIKLTRRTSKHPLNSSIKSLMSDNSLNSVNDMLTLPATLLSKFLAQMLPNRFLRKPDSSTSCSSSNRKVLQLRKLEPHLTAIHVSV